RHLEPLRRARELELTQKNVARCRVEAHRVRRAGRPFHSRLGEELEAAIREASREREISFDEAQGRELVKEPKPLLLDSPPLRENERRLERFARERILSLAKRDAPALSKEADSRRILRGELREDLVISRRRLVESAEAFVPRGELLGRPELGGRRRI